VLVLTCAMFAAIYQAEQAARINPVEALRWE
jgi:ABC-type lipoprotein release transport system permease subunit